MLFPRNRRLLRRRLYRRPLLPFLLLATLVVDIVLIAAPEARLDESLWGAFAIGSITGQIALLAVWVLSFRRMWRVRMCIALLSVVALAMLLRDTMWSEQGVMLAYVACAFGSCLLSCGAVLGVRTWWRGGASRRRKWRFNVGSMITTTTLLALGVTIAMHIDWDVMTQSDVWVAVALESLSPAVVYAITLMTRSIRRAVYAILALVALGAAVAALQPGPDSPFISWVTVIWAYYLYGVGAFLTTSVWLLGLRVRRRDVLGDEQEPVFPLPDASQRAGEESDEAVSAPMRSINVVV